jgi:hypothetical protein
MSKEVKSVFDGWTQKAVGTRDDGNGRHCVLGWLDRARPNEGRYDISVRLAKFIVLKYDPIADPNNLTSLERSIENWKDPVSHPSAILAAANNMYDELTPERWREIDILTQQQPVQS